MFKKIFEHKILTKNSKVIVFGLNKVAQPIYVWDLFCASKKNILVVTNTLYEANMLYKNLSIYDKNNILLFPMDDFLVSEAVAVSPDLMSKRIETLNELVKSNISKIVITNFMGYLRFLPSKKLWGNLKINIKEKDEINRESLIQKLNMIGYKRDSLVTKTGEYANRGYILDVFPYGYENPIRIEFFDDEIESIREFNTDTQLSMKKKESVEICPFTEFINEKKVEDILERQSLLPRVVKKVSKIEDYLDNNITVYLDLNSIKLAYEKTMNEVLEFKETDQFNIDKYMFDLNEVIKDKYVDILKLDNYDLKKVEKEIYSSTEIEKFNGNYDRINHFLKNMLNSKKMIVVYLNDDHAVADFVSKTILPSVITNLSDLKKDIINIVKGDMPNGFIINDLVCLTKDELYKSNSVTTYRSKFKYGSKIKDVNKLKIGDYVVHMSHGIGRYLGIVTLTKRGLKKDYLNVEYKDGDKLYIPVEKIEYISKYSSNEGAKPRLNKLGGTEWAKQKARVKGKVKDIARKLLETSAKRKLVKGFAFFADDEDQTLFESKFPYTETKDQLRAINDIKEDMEQPHPMDRLLCGDVGYGKTEVAFRAIFKAIKSGKQVAFLCPTTILSKQHYDNAVVRFDGFGINIRMLNRFVTLKQKEIILDELKSGKVDLIVGTHRLLSRDVIYKDLGLLVVDEEQRFGVTHKEKIKEYKENIDVLTLSATPIPRTLQMSLTGVRGLSLIETPPAYRYPIQTYVLKENDQVIRDAIYKELARDGQVFVLYNKVLDIEDKLVKIKKLVPEAKITYIHGRMTKDQIEKTMESFVDKTYNVLVCTTIIETGIDIENANTLIVLDADHFGLSQLYQIRGRIGRGKVIAYAYLMYQKNKELNDIAVKRLDAIKEFTELGSGYALAMRDLAIRGAGDILGSEQSGFIDTVGYDMYLKILNEEVERLKNNVSIEDDEDKMVNEKPLIEVATHISDKYADSEDLKIEIHKKINTIDSYDKFIKVKEELTDRFGSLDDDIIIYMLEELFECNAKKKGIFKVIQTEREISVFITNVVSKRQNGANLLSGLFKINPNFEIKYINNILRISLKTNNLEKHFLHYLVKMLDVIE